MKFLLNTYFSKSQVRITGSIAYSLYTYYRGRGAGAENWDEKLRGLLFSSFQGNEYTLYGKQYEDKCLQLYENDVCSDVLKNCGILINPKIYWFAYSPDGFVKIDNEIVLLEVKCLQIGKEYAGNSFCEKVSFLKMCTNGEFEMIKNHAYYGQIQLGLFVCNLQRAKLLLFVKKEPSFVAIDVPRDEDFLVHFVNTLTNVYREYFLLFLCKNENKIK